LKDLSFGHHVCRLRDELQDGKVSVFGHQFEGFRVKEITDEDACLVAPDAVCGNPPASRFRVVNHVVVKERGGVYELDHRGQRIAALAFVTAEFGGGQKQKRAKTFPAASDQVVDDLRDQLYLGLEVGFHVPPGPFQIIPKIVKDILHLHFHSPSSSATCRRSAAGGIVGTAPYR